ncbi:MAG: sodium:solute symporter family protein [bacterium]|nr:sodium:solute symporter family protein [bacterium]
MHPVDYAIIIAYLAVQMYLGVSRRIRPDSSATELIIGGRVLTLPAFVASLVSTYYGGILGVGEYSYNYGLSNWLVLGVPYYVAALLFALFLARKARETELLTIPDRLAQVYGKPAALAGATIVFLMAIPGAYIVMLGVLFQMLFGWPFWVGVLAGTGFSTIYVFAGGFSALIRNDLMQFGLMFLGFAVLLIFLIATYGGLGFVSANVPDTHLTWHGGRSIWAIAVWYFIALTTLTEPAFFQRCYAAKTPQIARRGIILSVCCWAIFDFMTTSCGLYARALLPELADPLAAYPTLANQVLPVGISGLFAVAMLVTVMSTVDSYSFIAASTFSNDLLRRIRPFDEAKITRMTRIGLGVSTLLALAVGLFFRSAVDIWYAFGSIGAPALVVPVVSSFVGKRRFSGRSAMLSILLSGALSLVWYLSSYWQGGEYWLGIEPILPGLGLSLILYLLLARRQH